ncbi:hypothetical protein, partial [uncultured Prevotella sp.]|uniref:hypothetical protein n=1 Tax=uncultured Prevotella sp. TaxID=159272 RepID=UPI00259B1FA2
LFCFLYYMIGVVSPNGKTSFSTREGRLLTSTKGSSHCQEIPSLNREEQSCAQSIHISSLTICTFL